MEGSSETSASGSDGSMTVNKFLVVHESSEPHACIEEGMLSTVSLTELHRTIEKSPHQQARGPLNLTSCSA